MTISQHPPSPHITLKHYTTPTHTHTHAHTSRWRVPDNIPLVEAKLNKGQRILWEVAVTFSERLSDVGDGRTRRRCGRVIRVWAVVEDHDEISEEIAKIVEVQKVINAHKKGKTCLIDSILAPSNTKSAWEEPSRLKNVLGGIKGEVVSTKEAAVDADGTALYTPRLFMLSNPHDSNARNNFPPASPEEDDYTLLNFTD